MVTLIWYICTLQFAYAIRFYFHQVPRTHCILRHRNSLSHNNSRKSVGIDKLIGNSLSKSVLTSSPHGVNLFLILNYYFFQVKKENSLFFDQERVPPNGVLNNFQNFMALQNINRKFHVFFLVQIFLRQYVLCLRSLNKDTING